MAGSRTRKRPLFVLGVDRSGTSLVSELLFRWGAHPGDPDRLPQGDAGNPQGYWEYQPIQDFVAELVNSVGCSLWDPAFKEAVRRQASDLALRARALELAAEMESPGLPWFWKEPEFVLTLPFWVELFPDAVYLITLRNPHDSALSYKKFYLPAMLEDKVRLTAYFFLRWQHFMVSIFEELKHYRPKLLVQYEELVSHPHEQCDRICRFLAAEYGDAVPSGRGGVDQMTEAISPRLWRNNGGLPFAAAPGASAAQKDLYAYLASHAEGGLEGFDPAHYPFPECFAEYMSNMAVFKWLFDNL